MGQHEYTGLVGPDDEIMTIEEFESFGTFLHNILSMNWAYCGVHYKRPAVAFPEKCRVGKYARSVIYYVSGWTLYKMSAVLAIGFGGEHCLGGKTEKDAGLPTSLVERRKGVWPSGS